MSDEGKYPFEGTPDVTNEFSGDHKKDNEIEEAQKQAEEDKKYEEFKPEYKPDWAKGHYEFTKHEEHLPYILPQNYRQSNLSQEEQNYDVIKDNNIETGIDLSSEWSEKVWEAPSPEIGDD